MAKSKSSGKASGKAPVKSTPATPVAASKAPVAAKANLAESVAPSTPAPEQPNINTPLDEIGRPLPLAPDKTGIPNLTTPAIPPVSATTAAATEAEADSELDGLSEAQLAAFNKHKNMQWETTADANVAEAITRHVFGNKGKNKFTLAKHLKGANSKEVERTLKIAKQLGFDDLVNDQSIAPLI